MYQLLFLIYIFTLGYVFGINFYPKLSITLVSISSFIWGSVILAVSSMLLRIFHISISQDNLLFFLIVLLVLPLSTLIIFVRSKIDKRIFSTFFLSLFIFVLCNVFLLTYNFSLGTVDSFALILLGRLMAFDGLTPNVLNSFCSWGILIPSLHSFSGFLGIDYLVTLEPVFGISLLSLFAYICFDICSGILKDEKRSLIISFFTLVLFVSTPMFIIQSFFIHTNLPAATFFLLSVFLSWKIIKNQENELIIPFFISLLGLSTSRSETFIYCIPVLYLLIFSIKKITKPMLLGSTVFFILICSWLAYLYFTVPSGTLVFNKSRLLLLFLAFVVLLIGIFCLQIKRISEWIRPLAKKFFLLPFILLFIGLFIANPDHMLVSTGRYLQNLFFLGEWGVVFWIWFVMILCGFIFHQNEVFTFLNKISITILLIINSLGFFRNPFRVSWTDSGNRLITLIFPLIILMVAVLLSNRMAPVEKNEAMPIVKEAVD